MPHGDGTGPYGYGARRRMGRYGWRYKQYGMYQQYAPYWQSRSKFTGFFERIFGRFRYSARWSRERISDYGQGYENMPKGWKRGRW